MSSLRSEPLAGDLASALAPPEQGLAFYWLGQAGFVLRFETMVVLVDPYLSDALAQKYAGSPLPHTRMMPAPIAPRQLPAVDLVLITHRHGDHLDRPTLAAIASQSPECRFVLPAAEAHRLTDEGIAAERVVGVDAGQRRTFGALTVDVLPAAHETIERDASGRHRYLGYVLGLGGVALYHSGDCVPFAGLDDALSAHAIDVALLPVNGRDSYRAGMGIPGNFTLDEALALCRRQRIPTMVAHHFGMFAFNTLAPELIEKAAQNERGIAVHTAALRTRYVVESGRAASISAAANVATAV